MPWVNQEMCTGCGICVDECPVDAIKLDSDQRASINDPECIRCGRCHDVCPQEAVRHDSERIPLEIAENLRWVRKLLDNFDSPSEQAGFMERIGRHFNKERKIIEQTQAELGALDDNLAEGLDAAIRANLDKQQKTD